MRERTSLGPPEDRIALLSETERRARCALFLFGLTGLSSFYKQAPSGRPVPGRLSVLEHVGGLGGS